MQHPKQSIWRYVHSAIFFYLADRCVGYLMRLAYELGYSNACILTRGALQFLSLDEITFKHPVPIGSILRLKSRIAHTIPTMPSSVVSRYFD